MVIGGIILICCIMDVSTTFLTSSSSASEQSSYTERSNTKYNEGLSSQDPTDPKDQIQKMCSDEINHMNELKTYILRSATINNTDKDNLNTYMAQIQTSTQNYFQYWSNHIGNTNDPELLKYADTMQGHKKIFLNYVKNTSSIITVDKDKIYGYFYVQLPENIPQTRSSFRKTKLPAELVVGGNKERIPPDQNPPDKNTVTPTMIPTVAPTKKTGFMSDPDIKWSKGQNWTPVPEFTPSAMAPFQQNMPTLSPGATSGLGAILDNTKSMMSNVQGNQSNVYKLFGKS